MLRAASASLRTATATAVPSPPRRLVHAPARVRVSTNTPGAGDAPLDRLKHSSRGGQDLTHRYTRLERALRGKQGYVRDLQNIADATPAHVTSTTTPASTRKLRQKQPLVFAGLTIPDEPQAPGPDECCMSGCAICVHDLHRESLDAHAAALAAIRSTLSARGIPQTTWPPQLHPTSTSSAKRDPVLSAFEQMEMQLAARRAVPMPEGMEAKMMTRPGPVTTATTARSTDTSASVGALLEALSWMVFSRR
ncbi:hypothetical protein M0805_009681 [Coniferiporia weirii]|nr:hypothetical protein M0805_009681 [Coniferiporia weirii]